MVLFDRSWTPIGVLFWRHRSAPDSLENWHVGRVTNLFVLYCSIATMALSHILYHFRVKWRYWSQIAIFFIPTCIRRSRYGRPCRNIAIRFTEKLEWCGYPTAKKVSEYVYSFDAMHDATDARRTDRRTDTARQHRLRLCMQSRGKKTDGYRHLTLLHVIKRKS